MSKGSKYRPYNRKKFENNYERIFNAKSKTSASKLGFRQVLSASEGDRGLYQGELYPEDERHE